jgi:hypothetical protein
VIGARCSHCGREDLPVLPGLRPKEHKDPAARLTCAHATVDGAPCCEIKFVSASRIEQEVANLEQFLDDLEEPHDKYAGKAPHEVRGWQPS